MTASTVHDHRPHSLWPAHNWHLFSAAEQIPSYFEIVEAKRQQLKKFHHLTFSYVPWDNKTVYNFSLPLLNIFTNLQARSMPIKIARMLFLVLLCALRPRAKKRLLCCSAQSQQKHGWRQKCSQLREPVCGPALGMIFPEQLEGLEKPLPNGFGRNLVFTSDLINLNIFHFFVVVVFYLF